MPLLRPSRFTQPEIQPTEASEKEEKNHAVEIHSDKDWIAACMGLRVQQGVRQTSRLVKPADVLHSAGNAGHRTTSGLLDMLPDAREAETHAARC